MQYNKEPLSPLVSEQSDNYSSELDEVAMNAKINQKLKRLRSIRTLTVKKEEPSRPPSKLRTQRWIDSMDEYKDKN